ncbi:MAG: ATPase [Gammaproteobacteria bacterium SG8_30]|nr:MAG: ATPase [Gammaproteobacteria bacterium SG8_30]
MKRKESSHAPNARPTTAWHTLAVEEVCAQLGVELGSGLDDAEVVARRERYGPNAIREAPPRHWSKMLLAQFKDFMILVLLAAAVLAGLTGDVEDVVVILAIVILNAVIGFVQEYRAEAAIHALRRMAAPHATVRRGRRVLSVPGSEVVPGDVVILESGSVVPADLRLVETAELALQEAALTGESHAVEKRPDALPDPGLPIGDRRDMAFKGTVVARGRGVGLCVATGMETELGRIARLLSVAEASMTPLQLRLKTFGQRLSLIVLAICLLVFGAGILRGEDLVLMLLTSISLAVAAIPEALPAVVTISLALGARKMVAKNALMRRLPAVETLGSVTYVCSDKTGTLTQNRMQVRAWYVDGQDLAAPPERLGGAWQDLRDALAVSNDVESGPEGWVGDPTEIALCEAAAALGLDKSKAVERLPRRAEIPFDSDRQRMITVHATAEPGRFVAFVKGAPEVVLGLCDMPGAERDAAARAAESMAVAGRRVLAFGAKDVARADLPQDHLESGLRFLGLGGLEDPPRPEAPESVRACREAGITPVMITGDHPATARSIALEVGLMPETGRMITGRELDETSDRQLEAALGRPVAFARVSPEHKIRIVDALKRRGEFVAMTGDGVNDAPALKRADIGIAMGKSGTDVAREASDMVLLDDNFATIVHAVEEGRRMYDNVRKFVKYTMTSNSAEILTILLAPFLGLPLPLLPIHILWINLVTDGLPGLALAIEPAERGVMRRPPRAPDESIFHGGMWQHMVWVGGLMAGLALLSLAWDVGVDDSSWQTLVFTVLVIAQLMHVMVIRSERESLFTIGIWSNAPLAWVVAGSVALQLAIVYTPIGNRWFNTHPLSAGELAVAFGAAAVILLAVETEKALVRRGRLYGLSPSPGYGSEAPGG